VESERQETSVLPSQHPVPRLELAEFLCQAYLLHIQDTHGQMKFPVNFAPQYFNSREEVNVFCVLAGTMGLFLFMMKNFSCEYFPYEKKRICKNFFYFRTCCIVFKAMQNFKLLGFGLFRMLFTSCL
jgi:hypothetical protein